MNEPCRNLDEGDMARWIEAKREAERARCMLDENGISPRMLDTMLAVIAEGLTTNGTDMRSLLYCAFREAQKLQIKGVSP